MDNELNIAGASENILNTADSDILNRVKISADDRLFSGLRIGISISDSPDLQKLGYSAMHLQDAAVEFARYLLVNGATLVYGGDLRQNGFTHLFSELARLYTKKETRNQYRFINYFAWPLYLSLTNTMELDFKQNMVKIEKVPPPDSLLIDAAIPLKPDTVENRLIWAKSITYMREKMNEVCEARIFLGGQVRNFKGKYPGIIEEAYLALSKKIPTYFIGTYGGATSEIINLIKGEPGEILTEDYQCLDSDYIEFYKFWNDAEAEKINFEQLRLFFHTYSPGKLAEINGLNEEENSRLFEINYLPGMIYYILKGLTTIRDTWK